MHEASDQRQYLLATLPPSQRQTRAAIGVVVGLILAFCAMAPFANVQLWRIDAFIPLLSNTILITGLITSALLFSQFYIARRRALLVLASGYLFTALIVIPYALTFPGAFAPTGLFGAGLQTTAWLYTCWHVGSSLAFLVYVLIKDKDIDASISRHSAVAAIGLSIAVVIAIVFGLTLASVAGNDLLPGVILDGVRLNRGVTSLLGGLVVALNASALAMLWRRRRTVLDLWVMVTCCAWLLVATIAVTLIGARFSLGWYASRVFELIATFIVLLVLLSETTTLYASLARSVMRQRANRQARQIAMDAMAASIAHEISQPLTAMTANANSCLHLLKGAKPDLNEVREAIVDIVNDARRANEVIVGIRSMFKKGAHGRQLLDANELIREVLTMVELELRTHRVSVATDLRRGLPQLLADRGQLQQVFLNLIMNAIEAMDYVANRARVLRISSHAIQESSNVVVIVEDSGAGIEGEDSNRIFEPFFTTKSNGTGIGLTICRVIIESHDGSLRTSPNKPYGTMFHVTLPTGDL